MRKFSINLFIFIIPFILFCYVVDLFLCGMKKSGTHAEGEYPVWNAIYDGKVNSDVLIYGSSRALAHIDPFIVSDSLHKSAYNVGIDGHNFWLQYFRHQLILKHNTKPKLIIHSLDMFTLEKRKDLYNPDQFLPYMLFNEQMAHAISGYKGYSFSDYYIPALRFFGKTDAIFTAIKNMFSSYENGSEVRQRGYIGRDRLWNNDLVKAKKALGSYYVKPDSSSVALFEQYLKECKANNIRVILVYSPEYIEGQNFVSNRNEIMSLYLGFSKKYDIPYYDYSNDTMSFQTKYFYNSSHLNLNGSKLFTKKLLNDLKSNPKTN